MFGENLSQILRAVAESLRTPVILLLLLLIALAVIMLGTLITEIFTERVRLKAKMPLLVEQLKDQTQPLKEIIRSSGLLRRQKAVLTELVSHQEISCVARETLAKRLLYEEQAHYDRITRVTDLIARLGPMLGLLGTLIPLGPGLIALGQGDTYTLSQSLLVAFDTTIAGLSAAAVAFVVSAVRRNWYENYMTILEAMMECLLDREATGNEA